MRAGWNRRSSWLAVTMLSLLVTYAQVVTSLIYEGGTRNLNARFAYLGLSLVTLAVCLLRRKRWTEPLATVLFVALVLPSYWITWRYHVLMAHGTQLWVPFGTHRLYFVILAVLSPGRLFVNALLMLAFIVHWLVLWKTLDLEHVASAATPHEPWMTLSFLLVATVLLGFRISHERLIRDLERTRTRAEEMEQIARVVLTLRDRMNTPLQTLQLSAALLRAKEAGERMLAEVIGRATDRITAVCALLSRFDDVVEDGGGDGDKALMTDEEVERWIRGEERSQAKKKRDRGGSVHDEGTQESA